MRVDDSVTEVACWVHARRKFHDLKKATGAKMAAEALDRIGWLSGDVERNASQTG